MSTDDEVSLVEEPRRDSTGSHTKRKSKKTQKTDVRDITCSNLLTLRFLAGILLMLIYPGLPGCAGLTRSEMSGMIF